MVLTVGDELMSKFQSSFLVVFLFVMLTGTTFALSIKEYSRQIEAEPENPLHYIKRGDAYFIQHEFFDAVEDLWGNMIISSLIKQSKLHNDWLK